MYPDVRFVGRGRVRLFYNNVCYCSSHHAVLLMYESMQSLGFGVSFGCSTAVSGVCCYCFRYLTLNAF